VVRDLQQAGFEAFIVGGSVRDLLLGKAPKDFDVATNATPEEVQEVFPRCRLIGRRFRLAHVRKAGALIEVATFRGLSDLEDDREHSNGRILSDNVFGTVEEDAIRRDFTINALFLDPVSGEIRDYVGGYRDLKDRRLRLIGDPQVRYREDPVRLLRAARFVAKLGVEPDEDTAGLHPGTGAAARGRAAGPPVRGNLQAVHDRPRHAQPGGAAAFRPQHDAFSGARPGVGPRQGAGRPAVAPRAGEYGRAGACLEAGYPGLPVRGFVVGARGGACAPSISRAAIRNSRP
jgi:hypothetical protein